MITQFPAIYPDELLYSQLARYHARSGNLAYTFTAEQLFQSKTVRPDVEFLNLYTASSFYTDFDNVVRRNYYEAHDVSILWAVPEGGSQDGSF